MLHDPADEESALAGIIERLSARFPKAPSAHVVAAVEEARHHFERAKVRDFVPLLIEREARARLERPLRIQ